MPDKALELGARISTHGISPVYLQRASFISVLSFAFFLAMMFGYYIRESLGYFLLATAFLLLYLLTLFGWFQQRKSQVTIFENGLQYKNSAALWQEIVRIDSDGRIQLTDGSSMEIPSTIHDFEKVIGLINFRAGSAAR